ncbi:MAG: L,D-transpeptidase family protein [Methylococcaceae bacterium]|nr:L,D-transpeptidase family protein [Methylococcaceae bacterium]
MYILSKPIKTAPHFLPVLMLLYCFSQPVAAEAADAGISQTIETLLKTQRHPLLLQQDFSQQSQALTQLYGMNANQLLWLGEGRSEKNRIDALAVLSDAAADGLNPANYDAEPLRHYLQQATSLPQTAIKELASYDVGLSISLLRFVHDLHSGRINPRNLDYPAPFGSKPAIDAAALLMRHRDQQSMAELPLAAAPKVRQYQKLKQALTKFRQLAQSGPQTELYFPKKSLHPGDSHPQLPELRQRLREIGELTEAEIASIDKSETLYDEMTVAAVTRLQEDQGLNADGIIGKQTLALLNQSPTEKIALIELALERLRWLPELPDGPLIVVNIPAFQLWAFNSPADQNPLNMKVIVGKSLKNQTPMLWEEMEYLDFMPYWNIPRSIMTKEILPKMLGDYNYLAHEDIELISRSADNDSEYLDNVIDDIKQGRVRGRQRPGKKNPLGRVKFIFPNNADVYLHDTPTRNAFNRDRRDLSHGCVRVEDAEKLAEFVLDDQKGWDTQAIEEAMEGPNTRRVTLQKPIPVLFFYTTALVDHYGKPRFYPDIYGDDALLRNALNKVSLDDKPVLISQNKKAGD